MKTTLTLKQEKFLNSYIETGNASEAYRRAYSCENMKDNTINRKAFDLLNNGKIRARLREIQSELKKTSDIRKESILEELACIAFSDIRDYVKFDGKKIEFKNFNELTDRQARAIESIRQTRHGIELRLHGKNWTIERISKILGFDQALDLNVMLERMDEATLDSIVNKIISEK